MLALIAEHGAVNALLSAVIDEFAPDKDGVSVPRAKRDGLAGADELASFPPVAIAVR